MATLTRKEIREARDLAAVHLTELQMAQRAAAPHAITARIEVLIMQAEYILVRLERMLEK